MKKHLLCALVGFGVVWLLGGGREAVANEAGTVPPPSATAPALPSPGPDRGAIRSGNFPVPGAEYVIASHRPVLPAGACHCDRVVVLEHGRDGWYLVGFNMPAQVSWKRPEFHVIWLNLDHVITMDQVEEAARLIRMPAEAR